MPVFYCTKFRSGRWLPLLLQKELNVTICREAQGASNQQVLAVGKVVYEAKLQHAASGRKADDEPTNQE